MTHHTGSDEGLSEGEREMAEALHAEHAREFDWMQGTNLSDPVLASECGNCQRWARYALAARAAAPDALADAWNRGYAAGFSNAMRRMSDEPIAPTSPNPFLAERPTDGAGT